MTDDASIADDEFVIGASREQTVIPEVTRTQIVQFAGASGDYSPLHTDEPHARHAGYSCVMAHGMLAMGATERLLAEWVGRERLSRYRVRFVAPVWPGDSLHAVATVTDVRESPQGRYVEFDVRTTNQQGCTVLSGRATARI